MISSLLQLRHLTSLFIVVGWYPIECGGHRQNDISQRETKTHGKYFPVPLLPWQILHVKPRELTSASRIENLAAPHPSYCTACENTQALIYTSWRAVRYWITFRCITMWKSVNPYFLCNVTIKMDVLKGTDCDPGRFLYRWAEKTEETSLCKHSENIFAHSDRRFMSATDLQVSCLLHHLNHSFITRETQEKIKTFKKTKQIKT